MDYVLASVVGPFAAGPICVWELVEGGHGVDQILVAGDVHPRLPWSLKWLPCAEAEKERIPGALEAVGKVEEELVSWEPAHVDLPFDREKLGIVPSGGIPSPVLETAVELCRTRSY